MTSDIIFDFDYVETVRGKYSEVHYKTAQSIYRTGYAVIADTIKTLCDDTRCEMTARFGNRTIAALYAENGGFELYLYDAPENPHLITLPDIYPVTQYGIMPELLSIWIAQRIFGYAATIHRDSRKR